MPARKSLIIDFLPPNAQDMAYFSDHHNTSMILDKEYVFPSALWKVFSVVLTACYQVEHPYFSTLLYW